MAPAVTYLSNFHVLLPTFQSEQERTIDWLAAAHTLLPERSAHDSDDQKRETQKMKKRITRFGCDSSKIATRNSVLNDFTHTDWDSMRVFDLKRHPAGQGSAERSRVYAEIVNEIFLKFYAEVACAPSAMIHVTCTGYVSPSGAQRLVSERGWGNAMEVMHAYHMGCYASLPANRIAQGLLACHDPSNSQVDIVHTELCTLHMNPSLHSPEQLVVQSLFADGFIKYTVTQTPQRGLQVLLLREVIVPESISSMTWEVGDFGMIMSLSRDVPELIASKLPNFFKDLCAQIGISADQAKREALFAIHPGGPKIIDRIQEILELSDMQVAASRHILKNHGNMSSATLPHIWKRILDDPTVDPGQLVFTFAFGPGLTISSGVLRKT